MTQDIHKTIRQDHERLFGHIATQDIVFSEDSIQATIRFLHIPGQPLPTRKEALTHLYRRYKRMEDKKNAMRAGRWQE